MSLQSVTRHSAVPGGTEALAAPDLTLTLSEQSSGAPQMKSLSSRPNPLGNIPLDITYRIFEELIDIRTPRAALFCLSKSCVFFQKAVKDFLWDHLSGQVLKLHLQRFDPLQPYSDIFISTRAAHLKDTLATQRLFERVRPSSFRAMSKTRSEEIINAIVFHNGGGKYLPLRILWPKQGGLWSEGLARALGACNGKVLNLVFNDTSHATLANELLPALRACAPGSSVILELRRTDLDDVLLLELGKLCVEHPVIYQISLQSWKPDKAQAQSQFLAGLMCLPNAVQVVDMSYCTPVNDEVAASITLAIACLDHPIELRMATRDMSESAMKALIQAALNKNVSGILCRLELHVGEDMYRPRNPSQNGRYLDKQTKDSLKERGISFCKMYGCSEEKNPDFLFWL